MTYNYFYQRHKEFKIDWHYYYDMTFQDNNFAQNSWSIEFYLKLWELNLLNSLSISGSFEVYIGLRNLLYGMVECTRWHAIWQEMSALSVNGVKDIIKFPPTMWWWRLIVYAESARRRHLFHPYPGCVLISFWCDSDNRNLDFFTLKNFSAYFSFAHFR